MPRSGKESSGRRPGISGSCRCSGLVVRPGRGQGRAQEGDPGSPLRAPGKPGRVRPDVALGRGSRAAGEPRRGAPASPHFSAFAQSHGVLACFFLFFLVFKTLFLGALEP